MSTNKISTKGIKALLNDITVHTSDDDDLVSIYAAYETEEGFAMAVEAIEELFPTAELIDENDAAVADALNVPRVVIYHMTRRPAPQSPNLITHIQRTGVCPKEIFQYNIYRNHITKRVFASTCAHRRAHTINDDASISAYYVQDSGKHELVDSKKMTMKHAIQLVMFPN